MRCKTKFELSFVDKIMDKNQINHQLHHFYKILFIEKLQMQNENITAYLNQISIPVLTGEQSQTCEGSILENELLKALKKCQITSHLKMMA